MSRDAMRVAHVHHTYLPYKGGAAVRLSSILEAGAADGRVEYHVFAGVHGLEDQTLPADEVIEGVHVHRWRGYAELVKRLKAIHAQAAFDIVHVHNPRLFWLLRLTFRGRVRWVLESHGLRRWKGLKRVLAVSGFRMADAVVVLSYASREWLIERHRLDGSKIGVLRNGVDTRRFDPPASPSHLVAGEPGRRRAGYLGTFYDWQGVLRAIEAIPFVLDAVPDAEFSFTGAGPALAEMKRRVEQLGVEDHVEFRDPVPFDAVQHELRRLDLFLMLRPPALVTELTTPLKIFEVGLAGVPLLVTERKALLEVAGPHPEDYLWTAADSTPEADAELISRLLTADSREARSRAVAFARLLADGDLDWASVAEKQRRVYTSVLQARR